MSEDAIANFGKNVPMKRPGQPAELATAYVMLADPMSSYISGATIAVTGGSAVNRKRNCDLPRIREIAW
jgi:NAD(P)-dependent dehydrogenase (short-subunit alcohol dehydrogenase family)